MMENQLRTIVQSAIDQIGEPGLSIREIDKTDLGWMILFWVRTDTDTRGRRAASLPSNLFPAFPGRSDRNRLPASSASTVLGARHAQHFGQSSQKGLRPG